MKSLQKGFTLIELMIVIAIIAILAAIAIPTYQNYLVRAQVSEGLSLASSAKTGVSEYWTNHGGTMTSMNNTKAGVSSAASIGGKYVGSVTVQDNGNIFVQYGTDGNAAFGTEANSKINKTILTLSVTPTVGSVVWVCKTTGTGAGTPPVPSKYLPSTCR